MPGHFGRGARSILVFDRFNQGQMFPGTVQGVVVCGDLADDFRGDLEHRTDNGFKKLVGAYRCQDFAHPCQACDAVGMGGKGIWKRTR